MIINSPGIYDHVHIKGSKDRFALSIESSDVEVYFPDISESVKYGLVIQPPGLYEVIENIHIHFPHIEFCGGTALFIYHNKGYVRNVYINGLSMLYNGLSYTNSGAHGYSVYAGGQRAFGGENIAPWDVWRPVKGTEYVMTVTEGSENTRYTSVAVNNLQDLFPRGRLKPGILGELEIGQFAVDYEKKFTDVHVNLGLSLAEMNSKVIRFKFGMHAVQNIHLDTAHGKGQFDVNRRPEAAMFVHDDDVRNSSMTNFVAENAMGPALVNNGGVGNVYRNGRSINCARLGGAEFVVSPLSEDLLFEDIKGEKDAMITNDIDHKDYCNREGIKDIHIINYQRLVA